MPVYLQLTREELEKYFEYDSSSGCIRRIPEGHRRTPLVWSSEYHDHNGYKRVHVPGKGNTMVHRIIWAFEYGESPVGQIDHIDGNRSNNHISNLRLCTPSENSTNKKTPSHSKSGVKGVYYRKDRGYYEVSVNHKFVGIARTVEEGRELRNLKAKEIHGEFYKEA